MCHAMPFKVSAQTLCFSFFYILRELLFVISKKTKKRKCTQAKSYVDKQKQYNQVLVNKLGLLVKGKGFGLSCSLATLEVALDQNINLTTQKHRPLLKYVTLWMDLRPETLLFNRLFSLQHGGGLCCESSFK